MRRLLAELGGAAGVLEQLAGTVKARVRAELDGYAFEWLIAREDLPSGPALELLERLAARTGAKVELPDSAF